VRNLPLVPTREHWPKARRQAFKKCRKPKGFICLNWILPFALGSGYAGLGTYVRLVMVSKNRNQVGNIVALILLGLIVCAGVFLTIVLFLSPSVR
jgi:hypothetical protein